MARTRQHLVLSAVFVIDGRSVDLLTLVDCGATSCFISNDFVSHHRFPSSTLPKVLTAHAIDGRPLTPISQFTSGKLFLRDHSEEINLLVADTGIYDMVLGMPWLEFHNPNIDWRARSLTFDRCDCSPSRPSRPNSDSLTTIVFGLEHQNFVYPWNRLRTNGRNEGDEGEIVEDQSTSPPMCVCTEACSSSIQNTPPSTRATLSNSSTSGCENISGSSLGDKGRSQSTSPPKCVCTGGPSILSKGTVPHSRANRSHRLATSNELTSVSDISVIDGTTFIDEYWSDRDSRTDLFGALWLDYVSPTLATTSVPGTDEVFAERPGMGADETLSGSEPVKTTDPPIDSLPPEIRDFRDVFDRRNASKLPPHRPWDLKIELLEGKSPPFGPLYSLSQFEMKVLREWLDDQLARGLIRPSQSSAASPILFIKKKNGLLRLCVDYRGLNAITRRNRGPLPRVDQLLENIQGASWFTKLDLRAAYNLLRIAKGDEWLTAFRTHYGLFETLVVPFGLTNAPPHFQQFMSNVLSDLLGVCCVVYLDDILIYSKTREQNVKDVKSVLDCLRKADLYANFEKCTFFEREVEYLGFIINGSSARMDPAKLKTVSEWPIPKNPTDVLAFLGYINFYRRFIPRFSSIARPLNHLTHKDVPWTFELDGPPYRSFMLLREAMLSDSVLRRFDPTRRIEIFSDASNWAVSGQICQRDDDGHLHPITYHSRTFTTAQANWAIYDKEMYAIYDILTTYRPWLVNTQEPILVHSDHKNLEHFFTVRRLNQRQCRWASELADYDFKISHIDGTRNPADPPTRRSDFLPSDEGDERLTSRDFKLLPAHRLDSVLRPQALELENSVGGSTSSKSPPMGVCTEASTSFKNNDAALASEPCNPDYQFSLSLLDLDSPLDYDLDDNFAVFSEERSYGSKSPPTCVCTSGPSPSSKAAMPSTRANFYAPADLLLAPLMVVPPNDLIDDIKTAWSTDAELKRAFELGDDSFERKDGLVKHNGLIFVPSPLRARVLHAHHDVVLAGHPGRARTLGLILRTFSWPKIRRYVTTYVRSCDLCQRTKAPRHKPYGELLPLAPPRRPWLGIAMDFIVKLPPATATAGDREYDSIWVIADRFSRAVHFVPCSESMNADELAHLFIIHIVRLHGLPDSIVTDRGSLFTSEYWRRTLDLLGIESRLSTAFHPQTDGQVERSNQTLEAYLRAYVSYSQDNWPDYLPLAEFAFNNSVNSSLGTSPFYAQYGFHPRFDLRVAVEETVPDAEARMEFLQQLWEDLQAEIELAGTDAARYANRSRGPSFKPGDQVMLLRRNLSTTRSSEKLEYVKLGPFTVVGPVGKRAYQLALPEHMQLIHPVFNVSLLERFEDPSQIPDRINPDRVPDPEIRTENVAPEYQRIERVLDLKWIRRKPFYLIQWFDKSVAERSWRSLDDLPVGISDKLVEFHRRHPRHRLPAALHTAPRQRIASPPAVVPPREPALPSSPAPPTPAPVRSPTPSSSSESASSPSPETRPPTPPVASPAPFIPPVRTSRFGRTIKAPQRAYSPPPFR